MYDVITIGSALLDTFIHSSQFRLERSEMGELLCQLYGDKLEVDSLSTHTGGGGSNTAVGFARMGFSTATVTETGKDLLSAVILEDFARENVSTELIIQEKKEQTGGAVILVGKDGGRSALIYRGASSQLGGSDIPVDHLRQARWVHLCNVGGSLETVQQVTSAVKDGNRKLSWNPGKQEIELLVGGQLPIETVPVEILIVNDAEWQQLFPIHESLLNSIPQIVITAGRRGGAFFDRGVYVMSFGSANVTSVDDTGAGDAFCVGFVSGRLAGLSAEEAIQWGVSNAASVVQHMGAKSGLLRRHPETNQLQLPTSQTQK